MSTGAPTLDKFPERLYERSQPLAPDDDQYGWALAILCQALLDNADQLEEGFDPEPPSYPIGVLMTYNAPEWALPWAAQIVGVQGLERRGLDEQQTRDLMADAPNWDRGTTAMMEAAIMPYLTGTKTVMFRERYAGNAWVLQVVTKTSETPDPVIVGKVLMNQKPCGIVLDYHTVAGWDYVAMTQAGGSYTALKAAYASYIILSNGP